MYPDLSVNVDNIYIDGEEYDFTNNADAYKLAWYESVGNVRIFLQDNWGVNGKNTLGLQTAVTSEIKVVFTVDGLENEGTSNVTETVPIVTTSPPQTTITEIVIEPPTFVEQTTTSTTETVTVTTSTTTETTKPYIITSYVTDLQTVDGYYFSQDDNGFHKSQIVKVVMAYDWSDGVTTTADVTDKVGYNGNTPVKAHNLSNENFTYQIALYIGTTPLVTRDGKAATVTAYITGLGDVNQDGYINQLDAALVISEYNSISTGGASTLSELQLRAADANGDGCITKLDATYILAYYTFICTGGNLSFEEFAADYTPTSQFTQADGGFTADEIAVSPIKPNLYIEEKVIENPESGDTVTVDVSVDNGSWASVGIHINYDSNLTLTDVTWSDAIRNSNLMKISEEYKNGIFLAMANSADTGITGTIATLTFKLPDEVYAGDFFGVSFEYTPGDLFTNHGNDEIGRLMQAYVFTRGLNNGGISVSGSGQTNTTTATSAAIITTTTTTHPISCDVSVSVTPTKTVYAIGEELDLSGGYILANGVDEYGGEWSASYPMTSSKVIIDSHLFNNQTKGTYNIYVLYTYNELTAVTSFAVTVGETESTTSAMTTTSSLTTTTVTTTTTAVTTTTTAAATTTAPITTVTTTHPISCDVSVSVTPTKTVYAIGEELDLSGGYILATGTDEYGGEWSASYPMTSSKVIIDSHLFNNQVAGIYTIYVLYTYNELTTITSFAVTVEESAVTTSAMTTTSTMTTVTTATTANYAVSCSVFVVTVPTKTVYAIGEELDLSGGYAAANGIDENGAMWDTFRQPMISSYFIIDSNAFNNQVPGTYYIYIRYAYNEKAVTYFKVTVEESIVATATTSAAATTTTSTTTTVPTTAPYLTTSTESLKLGDINQDDTIDARDASLALTEYAIAATGGTSAFNEDQRKAADVNGDGAVDARDASIILGYYAYLATNGIGSLDEFIKRSS